MRRLLLILLATVPLTGCQLLNRDQDIAVIDVVEAIEDGALDEAPAIPSLGGGAPEAEGNDAEAFEDPTVAAEGTGTTVSADLIRSTDPAARTRLVSQSRTDPFATLPIPPEPEPVVIPESARNGAGAGARAAGNNAGGGNAAAGATASRPPEPTPPPVRVQPNNEPLVTPSPIAALPAIPQPVIAPTISISGVIQLGNEPYAILRSGGEPERYVKVGDRIANGAVRVKRIETLAFEPRVILEENGIEVSRPISAGADEANEANEPPVEAVEQPVAGTSNSVPPVAAVPVIAPSSVSPVGASGLPPLPMPAAVPNTQAVLPGMATATPVAPAGSGGMLPMPGVIPDSLLLMPAEDGAQAVLPNMQLSVPKV